jgi:hypothetical protein
VEPLPAQEPGEPPKTKRQRLEQHVTDPTCRNCHQAIDPLGFPLEHFDAIGAYRDTENGQPIDASGDLDGVAFYGAPGYAKALGASEKAARCIGVQFFRYAAGRRETDPERTELDALVASSPELSRLIVEIVKSRAFRTLARFSEVTP